MRIRIQFSRYYFGFLKNVIVGVSLGGHASPLWSRFTLMCFVSMFQFMVVYTGIIEHMSLGFWLFYCLRVVCCLGSYGS